MGSSSDRTSLPLAAEVPEWQHRLWLFCLCTGMLLFFTQVTAFFPVLPVYLTQRWGPEAPVGLVVGAMAAGLLFFRPWLGMLIDRWGRKPVLWLGLLIMIAILPLYSWSPTPTWLMAVRVLHGISQAALATASQTMLVDLVAPERRTAMLGYLAMSNTIGFSLGPLVGSLIYAATNFTTLLTVLMGITLLGFAVSLPLPWLKAPAHTSPTQANAAAGFPWQQILSFPVRDATFIFFISSFLHGGIVTFLPLFIDNSAQFYSLNALVAIGVRFGLGRWGNRLSARWVVSLGIFCSGTALIGLSLMPHLLVIWSIVYGLGFGSLFPVLSAIVSLSAPAAVRGRVYSFFLAGFDGGMTIGGAGIQPFTALLPLGSLFTLLGMTGCGVSFIAFRQLRTIAKPV